MRSTVLLCLPWGGVPSSYFLFSSRNNISSTATRQKMSAIEVDGESPLDDLRSPTYPASVQRYYQREIQEVIVDEIGSQGHGRIGSYDQSSIWHASLDLASNQSCWTENDRHNIVFKQKPEQVLTLPTEPDFPEGGREAWLVVAGAFCAVMVSFGMVTSFGVFQTYYTENLGNHHSESAVSWIGSIQTAFFYLFGLPVGMLLDAHEPGWMLLGGSVALSLGLVTTSLGHRYWHYLLSQGALVGIGSALLFYPAMYSAPSYFLKRRGLAVGIVASGAAVGGLIWPIVIERLFTIKQFGFKWSILTIGLACLVLSLPASFLVKSRVTRRKTGPWLDVSAWRDARYSATVLGATLSSLGMFVPHYYIESYAILKGVSKPVAVYSVTALNGGSLVGRLLVALVSDRLGRYNTLLLSSLMASVVCLLVWPLVGLIEQGSNGVQAGILLFGFGWGLANGAYLSAAVPALATFAPLARLGTRAGMLFSMLAIPCVTSPRGALHRVSADKHGP